MNVMRIGDKLLFASMVVRGMDGTQRREGEDMGSVYGSTFKLVGLGSLGMFGILLVPGIRSCFGWIGGAKRGCYGRFSLPYIRLLFINRQQCLNT